MVRLGVLSSCAAIGSEALLERFTCIVRCAWLEAERAVPGPRVILHGYHSCTHTCATPQAFTCVLGVASGIEHIECGKLHGVLKIVGVICSLAGAVCNTLLSSGSSAPSALNTTLCSALQPAPGVEANVSFFMLQQPHATAAVGSTQLAALATNASVPAFVAHGCEHVTVVYTSNQQVRAFAVYLAWRRMSALLSVHCC